MCNRSGGVYPVKVKTSNGELVLDDTSSRRFKQDISPFIDDGFLYKLNPMTFRYKNDPEILRIGLISEDIAPLDTERRYVIYDKDGLPEGIAYDKFITPLIACVKALKAEIEALKAQINST